MSNDLYINNVLDEYLQRQRNQEETAALLVELGVEDPLNEMILHQAAAVVLQRQAVIDQVKRVHDRFVSGNFDKKENIPVAPVIRLSRSRQLITWSIRIAAVLILAAGGWWFFQYSTNSPEKLYSELYQPYQLNTERSVVTEVIPHRMVEEFGKGNYDSVTNIFEKLPEKGYRERFLAALAYVQTNRDDQAVKLFRYILDENKKQNTHFYDDQAEFYLALACLRLGNTKEATTLFQKMHDDPYHTYHQKAGSKVMQRLRWLN